MDDGLEGGTRAVEETGRVAGRLVDVGRKGYDRMRALRMPWAWFSYPGMWEELLGDGCFLYY